MEEDFLPNSIAEEQFRHNHENCIKAQSSKPMDEPGIVSLGEINESIYEDMCKDIELHQESKPSYCSLMTPESPESSDWDWDLEWERFMSEAISSLEANFSVQANFHSD